MHQVPSHECGVAIGEIVLRASRTRVEVRRPRPGLTNPTGVCLWRDDTAEMLWVWDNSGDFFKVQLKKSAVRPEKSQFDSATDTSSGRRSAR